MTQAFARFGTAVFTLERRSRLRTFRKGSPSICIPEGGSKGTRRRCGVQLGAGAFNTSGTGGGGGSQTACNQSRFASSRALCPSSTPGGAPCGTGILLGGVGSGTFQRSLTSSPRSPRWSREWTFATTRSLSPLWAAGTLTGSPSPSRVLSASGRRAGTAFAPTATTVPTSTWMEGRLCRRRGCTHPGSVAGHATSRRATTPCS
mmetsp:Transcript_35868/g.83601  ORF Transcript_35868/g.83601 Transcript_35868/m.83601 type:complete len:204 (+) Transcript_35868:4200-4811(+)